MFGYKDFIALFKAKQIEQIEMLGAEGSLDWSQNDNGLRIATPAQKPCDHAYSFRITLK